LGVAIFGDLGGNPLKSLVSDEENPRNSFQSGWFSFLFIWNSFHPACVSFPCGLVFFGFPWKRFQETVLAGPVSRIAGNAAFVAQG
jgi:hypothetical protein